MCYYCYYSYGYGYDCDYDGYDDYDDDDDDWEYDCCEEFDQWERNILKLLKMYQKFLSLILLKKIFQKLLKSVKSLEKRKQ